MSEKAVFAGGCFWGIQYYFDQVPGVISTKVGYTGGDKQNPTYEEVCSGDTGHTEALEIIFDPNKVSYTDLLKHFFLVHDPTRSDGQGFDVGNNYRPVVFYVSEEQKNQAVESIASLEKSKKYNKPIKTSVEHLKTFWVAEEYHQKYAERTGRGMCHVDYKPLS
jgi:methionine-S-sulfoxide reductase